MKLFLGYSTGFPKTHGFWSKIRFYATILRFKEKLRWYLESVRRAAWDHIYIIVKKKIWSIFKADPGPKPCRSGLWKPYEGITSDRAEIFTRYSWICILIMVVAPTRETFSRLFYSYRMSKNPRFLIENPVLGFHITFWRKTKVIFGISSSSCIRSYIKRVIFVKVNFGWNLAENDWYRFFTEKSSFRHSYYTLKKN